MRSSPIPTACPASGTGLGLVGGAMNIAGTHTDAYGMFFGGEITGLAAGVADLHLIPKTLILDTGISSISAATIQSYSSGACYEQERLFNYRTGRHELLRDPR